MSKIFFSKSFFNDFNQFALHSKFSIKIKKLILSYHFKKQFEDQTKKFKNTNSLFFKSAPQTGFINKYVNSKFKSHNDVTVINYLKKKKIFKIKKKYIKQYKLSYLDIQEKKYRKNHRLKSIHFL
jgi:hypothetical protein